MSTSSTSDFSQQRKQPIILSPAEHPITEESLSMEVVWILNRLRSNGYLAFVVGGAVRDLLLGEFPNDFDLGTDASPEDIRELFYNCRIIGRRFRIAHIYFRYGGAIELSTFRQAPDASGQKGPLQEDNEFGSPAEDAWRRDLSINGLFYDSGSGKVIDYVGGLVDLRSRVVRMIGSPLRRFREDPVRMIRAIRHAVRHHLKIEPETWQAINKRAKEIKLCAPARIQAEFLKDLESGRIARLLQAMLDARLLQGWMPSLHQFLTPQARRPVPLNPERFGPCVHHSWGSTEAFWRLLSTLDMQICNGHSFSETVSLAALFLPVGWDYVLRHAKPKISTHRLWKDAMNGPMKKCFAELPVRKAEVENIQRLLHTYWRLHLFPHQSGLEKTILSSPFLDEAIQLIKLELQAHLIPFPAWLDELRPSDGGVI